MTTPSPSRDGADRCPGLLAPFVSADGAMVRLRIPGGRVDVATLAEISALAGRFGDPTLTLTSRGSLQLRGLPEPLPRELVTAIGDLGLVPSGAHDKARNVVADPDARLDDLVTALDSALLADPDLARLPGRFLLGVGIPSGPVLGEPWDIAVVDEGSRARVVVGDRAVVVPREDAPEAALDVARRFLAARTDARTWHVRDLPADARAARTARRGPRRARAAGVAHRGDGPPASRLGRGRPRTSAGAEPASHPVALGRRAEGRCLCRGARRGGLRDGTGLPLARPHGVRRGPVVRPDHDRDA